MFVIATNRRGKRFVGQRRHDFMCTAFVEWGLVDAVKPPAAAMVAAVQRHVRYVGVSHFRPETGRCIIELAPQTQKDQNSV